MNKLFKRMLALSLALVMMLSLAITAQADEFDPRSVCEGVKITIAVPADDEVIDWDTNALTLYIEESLGVDLEFNVYASADYLDKLNVMVNGGAKLPDIIFGSDHGDISANNIYLNWAEAGAIIPLNEYYENPAYAKNVNDSSAICGVDIPAMIADPNGVIWGVPRLLESPTQESRQKMWISTKYMEKVGVDKVPTNTEEYYELCKAFADAGDLNGNGIADEIALPGQGDALANLAWFNYLMSAYVYAWDDFYLDVTDGELEFAYTTDAWKEGLKYIKRFFDEGIFDKNMLTMDGASYTAIISDPAIRCLSEVGYYPGMTITPGYVKHAEMLLYEYVPALDGPEKEGEAFFLPSVAKVAAVISADCENPLAAFLVLDFMCSEEMGLSNRFGRRGIDWVYNSDLSTDELNVRLQEAFGEGKTADMYSGKLKSEYPVPVIWEFGTVIWGKNVPQNRAYMHAGPFIRARYLYMGLDVLYDESTPETKPTALWNQKYADSMMATIAEAPAEHILRLPMTADEAAEVNEIQLGLNSYVFESIGAFLSGAWDIDAYWDTYLGELDKIGVEDALAMYQTSFDRTK